MLAYVNRTGLDFDYVTDNNGDGMPDGEQLDRTPSIVPSKPWQSGPPNDTVTLQDVLVALAQVGTSCA